MAEVGVNTLRVAARNSFSRAITLDFATCRHFQKGLVRSPPSARPIARRRPLAPPAFHAIQADRDSIDRPQPA